MDSDLSKKIIFITGGAGILGKQFCLTLLKEGSTVILADNNIRSLDDAKKEIGDYENLVTVELDITDKNEVCDTNSNIKSNYGEIDVLINNAATKSPNFFTPFEDFPLQDWNDVMDVNTTGAMICCQVIGGDMAKREKGNIINTLSVYGIVAPDQRIYDGAVYNNQKINTPAVYSVSKAALLGLTKYLAAYWGGKGVRVNSITPGGIFSGQNEEFIEKYSARVPLGRMAKINEMNGALKFLASDASSYITGHNIVVDGGLTVW